MPNIRCAVPTCVSKKGLEHIKFYSFPREPNRQKLWIQMIGRVDITVERDISKNYIICNVHFHPLMIENGRLKVFALPIIRVSSDSLISSKHSKESQTCHLVSARYTQTDNVQLSDMNVQTNDIESFGKDSNSVDILQDQEYNLNSPSHTPTHEVSKNEDQSQSLVEDKYDSFGKYLATEMSNMPQDMAIYCQKIISEAIFEGRMGNLNRKSRICTKSLKRDSEDDDLPMPPTKKKAIDNKLEHSKNIPKDPTLWEDETTVGNLKPALHDNKDVPEEESDSETMEVESLIKTEPASDDEDYIIPSPPSPSDNMQQNLLDNPLLAHIKVENLQPEEE